jgi:beta-lactamase regulating signal transducer with metallopeptidase domain
MQLAAVILAVQSVIPVAGDSFSVAWRALSAQAAAMAVAAVWQGAVLACCLAVCLRLVPRTSAANRFAIWAAAFVTLVSLSLFAFIAALPAAAVSGVAAAPPEAAATPWVSIDARWSFVIAALWAAATLFRAGDLVLHSFRLRKLWKDALPVDLADRLIASADVEWSRGPIQVCTTTALQRPGVIGFFKPRILIPDWLYARLTPGELDQIVLHEAEHLRRHDDWTNLFQKLCLVLFPLNPALLLIERRLCQEREMACDDGVIGITHAPRAYAACLASLAERGLQRRAEALSLGAWQRRPELVHRVHSILRRKHTLGPLGARVLLGVLGCGLLVGSVELERCPRLIAFVQAPNVEAPRPQAQLPSSAYVPVRVAAIDRATTGSRSEGIASTHAAGRRSEPVAVSPSLRRNTLNQDAALEWKTSSSESAPSSPRAQMLAAELPGPAPAPAQDQQWIVLTTWEQIQPSSRSTTLTADYETGPKSTDESDTKAQPSSQSSGQIIVTRLILRIFPANSVPTQPASAPMRSGWFVIQL